MSTWELIVIVLVALIVIKPERFPELAYLMGRTVYKLKSFYQQLINKTSSV